MARTDWNLESEVQPADMNQIGQEINQLREDLDDIPPASTSEAGIVQLNNAIDSTSQTEAATANAVRLVVAAAKAYTDAAIDESDLWGAL